VRFSCGSSGANAPAPGGLPVNPLSSQSCTPFTAEEVYFDQDHIVFLVLDALIVLGVSLFVLASLRTAVVDSFVAIVHSIGPEAFFERAGSAVAPDEGAPMMKTILEASGPLFFLDFLVSTPHRCTKSLYDGLLSALLHYAFIILPAVPLVICLALLGCERDDAFDAMGDSECHPRAGSTIAFYLICAQQGLALLFACSWYLNLPFVVQGVFKKAALSAWLALAVLAVIYLVQSALFLFVAITVKPGASLTTLVLIGTPFLYIHLTSKALLAATPTPSAISVLIHVVQGAILILGLVGWLLLALGMFLPPTREGIGPIGASLGTLSSAWALGQSQIERINRQVYDDEFYAAEAA
jgi:hypothetical protein